LITTPDTVLGAVVVVADDPDKLLPMEAPTCASSDAGKIAGRIRHVPARIRWGSSRPERRMRHPLHADNTNHTSQAFGR
jgi:hypothetical protein